MTIALPSLPIRIARLPKDERGYPVPAFVIWIRDGKQARRGAPGAAPDFRFADTEFRDRAFRTGLCWICGEPMGVHRVYVLGPMCVINRTTSEPASHRQCAEFAVKACPFLAKPRMRRLPMEEEQRQIPGMMLERNPGCACLYETREAKTFKPSNGGWLIRVGEPDRVDWWAEGRQATREEILASMQGGLPELYKMAKAQGQEAIDDLDDFGRQALKLLPAT